MRQHWVTNNVSNGKDMGYVAAHLAINRDEAAFGDVDACFFSADVVACRCTADGNKDAIIGRCF
ncbi:hypothetical protein XFLM_03480 [Xylella fastidiosa subsp. fastidiosa GB514]|nr:hypothetical protein XFLM_03480 [Xylella fastidiosa subsp. fastidiosa GB514]